MKISRPTAGTGGRDTVKGLYVKLGYLNESGEIVQNLALDPLFQEDSALYQATVHSIAGKIAFGPNTGQYARCLGQGFGYGEEIPLAKGRQCFSVNGFSLHANTAINTHSRDRIGSLKTPNDEQQVLDPSAVLAGKECK